MIENNLILDKIYNEAKRKRIVLTQEEYAKKLGISRSTLRRIVDNPDEVRKDLIDKAISMLSEAENVPRETIQETYLQKRRNLKNNHVKPGIAVYESAPTTLTTTEVYRDENKTEPDFWITIPFLRDCDYGCRAKGDSMHPLIRTNALIIGKRIHDFNVIIFGEIYTIKTKNNIETTKYIHPHPDNNKMILLVPYNDKAKTTPIYKTDILELYEAKAVFNNL